MNSPTLTLLSVNSKHRLLSNKTDQDCGSVVLESTMALVYHFYCCVSWCISTEFTGDALTGGGDQGVC